MNKATLSLIVLLFSAHQVICGECGYQPQPLQLVHAVALVGPSEGRGRERIHIKLSIIRSNQCWFSVGRREAGGPCRRSLKAFRGQGPGPSAGHEEGPGPSASQ